MQSYISIENAVARIPEFQFKSPLNWKLKGHDHWAVIGPNGAGKTLFSNYLTGKTALKEGSVTGKTENGRPLYEMIKSASFTDIYSTTDYKNMYYQQRWNSAREDSVPSVRDLINKGEDNETSRELFSLFQIEELLDKKLILLSSGELRKFLIIRMLLSGPRVLILDNPYIGLDAPSRKLLNELFVQLAESQQVNIILLLSDPKDIPSIINKVLPVLNKECLPEMSTSDFLGNASLMNRLFPVLSLPTIPSDIESETANRESVLDMQNINIIYGKRTILKNLHWKISRGERWALLGPNGAGKSTLLSLIYADNPQAYANRFSLFGRKRGTGESIWDIKQRIGYVSPEIHLYYQKDILCKHIVSSGFFDSIGLYKQCTPEQTEKVRDTMKLFEIEHLSETSFLKLSFGEQRLVILARAFVKNPELLILDEPLHGLDKTNKVLVTRIITDFCTPKEKSLIYVTHYPEELPPVIQYQLILKKEAN